MIESVRVKNFKSFSDTGKRAIKPITILIGPNSSGKSSFIQFLLLLKQTVESTSTDSPLVLNGRYINLGAFKDIVYKHSVLKPIEFEFTVNIKDLLKNPRFPIRYPFRNLAKFLKNQSPIITYKAKIKYVKPRVKDVVPKLRLHEFEVSLDSKEDKRKYTVSFKFDTKNQKYEMFINGKKVENPSRNIKRGSRIHIRPINFYVVAYIIPFFIDELPNSLGLSKKELIMAEFLLDSLRVIDDVMRDVYYIGPLREYPRRYYVLSGDVPREVGSRGENALSTLLTSRNQEYLLTKVNEWLRRFGLAKKFQIREIKSQILLEALVEDSIQELTVNISDVGFGLSQILPIIIEGFHAPPGSIILIEQPEIHLHPKLQADMADLFIDIANSGDKKLIIETHSEHIILRLQRRIIEGVIRPEDVAIYYFEMTKEGTNIRNISINELGELENWPEGFFEEDAREIIELTKARLNKLKNASHTKENT